jgi:hypothetical protein
MSGKSILALVAGALALSLSGGAQAATYIFSYSGGAYGNASGGDPVSASGSFTTADTPFDGINPSSGYLITSISGTRNGIGFNTLLPAGTLSGGTPTDNLFFTDGTPYFSYFGVAFTVGTDEVALYSLSLPGAGTEVDEYVEGDPGYRQLDFSLRLAGAVPEPASWALMIAGFGVLGVAVRRRSLKVSFA